MAARAGRTGHPRWRVRRAVGRVGAAVGGIVTVVVASTAAPAVGPAAASGTTGAVGAVGTVGAAAPARWQGRAVADGDWVGAYRTGSGAVVYCITPRAALPASVRLRTAERLPGVPVTESRELAYALDRWGLAATPRAAAAESQLLNLLAGNRADVARRAAELPYGIRRVVQAHLTTTRREAGPYRLTVRPGAPVGPGQTGTATVSVATRRGAAVPGVTVALSAVGARIARQVVTDAHGRASVPYTVTSVGEVHLTARATDLPATALRWSPPHPGEQTLISRAAPQQARAAASFRRPAQGFAHSYRCDSQCDGRPTVTLRACLPAGAFAGELTYLWPGGTRTVRFPARRSSRLCRSVSVPLADGTAVGARWRFRAPGGWTAAEQAPGGFVVDCPAVPAVATVLRWDCNDGLLVAALAVAGGATDGSADGSTDGSFTPWVNPTRHDALLTIGGSVERTVVAPPGATAEIALPFRCDAPRAYTVRAGIRRADGGTNWGTTAQLTTPGPSVPAPASTGASR